MRKIRIRCAAGSRRRRPGQATPRWLGAQVRPSSSSCNFHGEVGREPRRRRASGGRIRAAREEQAIEDHEHHQAPFSLGNQQAGDAEQDQEHADPTDTDVPGRLKSGCPTGLRGREGCSGRGFSRESGGCSGRMRGPS